MTETLARDELVGLLNSLGSEVDEEVLEAARQAHARIAAAGTTWDELLVPDAGPEPDEGPDLDQAEEVEDDPDGRDAEEEAAEPPAVAARKNAESLALIGKLLARKGFSEDLRRELEDYKTDIAEGEFEERDRRYLRALHARLSKRR